MSKTLRYLAGAIRIVADISDWIAGLLEDKEADDANKNCTAE